MRPAHAAAACLIALASPAAESAAARLPEARLVSEETVLGQLRRYAGMTGLPLEAVLARQAPAPAAGAVEALTLTGFVSAWTQDCAGGCALPKPSRTNIPAELVLALPSQPGQATVARSALELDFGPDGKVRAEMAVYAVCPLGGAGLDGGCPGLYFQAQVELSGAAQAFCAAALGKDDAVPFPVLMCAGMAPSRRLGLTLHRQPL
ncbi:MAG: hypothetical protein HY927_03790 [Elusimicrobia bacterium]|nr:hypothetical protein [Elusimicrobiota bacterium]